MIIQKESHAQKLKRVADALKTGFWLGEGYDLRMYKEIQVPTNNGECRFDYVMRVRPKLSRNDKTKYRGDLLDDKTRFIGSIIHPV